MDSSAIRVRVKFFGLALRAAPENLPPEGLEVELPPGSRVCDLLRLFDLSMARTIVAVDGKTGRWNTELADRAAVEIVKPHGGG